MGSGCVTTEVSAGGDACLHVTLSPLGAGDGGVDGGVPDLGGSMMCDPMTAARPCPGNLSCCSRQCADTRSDTVHSAAAAVTPAAPARPCAAAASAPTR